MSTNTFDESKVRRDHGRFATKGYADAGQVDLRGDVVCTSDGYSTRYTHRGLPHREDGPAVVWNDGEQQWWRDGELHREDGPAVVYADGSTEWRTHGELHREDGPAVVGSDGSRVWYRHDKLHRLDGPAVEQADGTQLWFVDDVRVEDPRPGRA